MDYNYNIRVGLIIQRDRYIDIVNGQDMINLYSTPPKRTFEPIFLNENTFEAYGFKKSKERYKGYYYYVRNDIIITLRPFTNKYYCPNLRISIDLIYLHELQDLFEMLNPIPSMKTTAFADFVSVYGSRYLAVWDN
jgi:hypothetical protein